MSASLCPHHSLCFHNRFTNEVGKVGEKEALRGPLLTKADLTSDFTEYSDLPVTETDAEPLDTVSYLKETI